MLIPPSLIGVPVAFLPVPLPQTAVAVAADAAVEPTGAAVSAVPAPMDTAVTSTARRLAAAHATPTLIFVDLISSLL